MKKLTRRSMIQSGVALGALGSAGLGRAALSRYQTGTLPAHVGPSGILPLSNTSGVFTPPRGRAFMKYSFDFPEPSVEWDGYAVSARVFTHENAYAIDVDTVQITRTDNGISMTAKGLCWAGGQEKAAGTLTINVRRSGDGLRLNATATVPGQRLKSIAIILRGVPRGQISRAGGGFSDPHDDEISLCWPELNAGITSPLVVVRDGSGVYTSLSLAAPKNTVRTTRFYMQPGPEGYRTELIYEREDWTAADTLSTPDWVIRSGNSYAAIAKPHYAHVGEAFGLKPWEERTDVPAWMRDVSLVMALHGAHWTGYIFNSYARQLQILRWTAEKIDPKKVLVFLPAWDGRYYWNYPAYEADPRMGGDEGFRNLIAGAQKLGFHMVPMFGSNTANRYHPSFAGLETGVTQLADGVPWTLDYVDWDNDRKGEANYPFMNLGTATWRKHLQERIAACLQRFGVDGYFLDIVGCAQNNRQGDMYLGTRQMVEELGRQFPGRLAIGEMYYDALIGAIPVFQAGDPSEYPAAFYKYGRLFEHLSYPAPGRGSSGVHESGFSSRWKLPTTDQRLIPTLTVVDDTFTKYRDQMEQVIAVARQWRFPNRSE